MIISMRFLVKFIANRVSSGKFTPAFQQFHRIRATHEPLDSSGTSYPLTTDEDRHGFTQLQWATGREGPTQPTHRFSNSQYKSEAAA